MHMEHYTDAPPSKSSMRYKDEPDGFRCDSWDEVRKRCGTLDVLGGQRQQNGESRELVVSDAAGAAQRADADATSPNTRPRTLELYAGRAGWSANLKRQGCDCWYTATRSTPPSLDVT